MNNIIPFCLHCRKQWLGAYYGEPLCNECQAEADNHDCHLSQDGACDCFIHQLDERPAAPLPSDEEIDAMYAHACD